MSVGASILTRLVPLGAVRATNRSVLAAEGEAYSARWTLLPENHVTHQIYQLDVTALCPESQEAVPFA